MWSLMVSGLALALLLLVLVWFSSGFVGSFFFRLVSGVGLLILSFVKPWVLVGGFLVNASWFGFRKVSNVGWFSTTGFVFGFLGFLVLGDGLVVGGGFNFSGLGVGGVLVCLVSAWFVVFSFFTNNVGFFRGGIFVH